MKAFWITIGLLTLLTAVILLAPRFRGDHLGLGLPTEATSEHSCSSMDSSPNGASRQSRSNSNADEQAKALGEDLEEPYEALPSSEKTDLQAVISIGLPRNTAMPESADGGRATIEGSSTGIVHKPDGSLLFDDRFVVKGSGTADDPYRFSWELLASAESVLSQHPDLKEVPARISFFNGKHVRIAGFVFTATYRAGATEVLVMRNTWDGCCIGVPPTPYDAIEVNLKESLSSEDLARSDFGTLDGVLKIDPCVKDNWLLGLYVVENGTVRLGDSVRGPRIAGQSHVSRYEFDAGKLDDSRSQIQSVSWKAALAVLGVLGLLTVIMNLPRRGNPLQPGP